MSRLKRFKTGMNILDAVTASYLNSLEDRLLQLENLTVADSSPLTLSETNGGKIIGLPENIISIRLGRLTAELTACSSTGTGTANLLVRDSSVVAICDQFTEDTSRAIDVVNFKDEAIPNDTDGLIIEHINANTKTNLFWPFPLSGELKVGKLASGGITALSGNTPGTGTVDIWEFSNGDLAASSPLEQVTAYNATDSSITNGDFVLLHKELVSNRWMIIRLTIEYKWKLRADSGADVNVDNNDIVDIEATGSGNFNARTQTFWGIDSRVNSPGGGVERVQLAIDKSPMQTIDFSGTNKPSARGGPDQISVNTNTAIINGQAGNNVTIVTSTANGLDWNTTALATLEASIRNPIWILAGSSGGPTNISHGNTVSFLGAGSVATSISGTTCTITGTYMQFVISGDGGSNQTINNNNILAFQGTGISVFNARAQAKWGILTATGVTDTVKHAVDKSVGQGVVFTGTNKPSTTDPTNVDLVEYENGGVIVNGSTGNFLIIVTSAANGIKYRTANTDAGSIEPYISDLFTFRDDASTTLAVSYSNIIDVSGGNGISVAISGTDIITAIDATVAQKVILTADGGTVAGSPVTILVTTGTDNAIQLNAGTNVTFVDKGDGSFTISTTGTGTNFVIAADSGTNKTISDSDVITLAGTAGEIDTQTGGADPNWTWTISVGDHIMKQIAYSAVDSATSYEGTITGTSPVPASAHAIANQIELQAGFGTDLEEVAGGKLIITTTKQYGKTQANSGDGTAVSVKLVGNVAGTVERGAAFNVTILSGSAGNNIRSGKVIPITLGIDGLWTTAAGASMPIGTIMLWRLAVASIPDGWKVMDGTANSSPGSVIDMKNKFARGSSGTGILSSGGGGADDHTHTIPAHPVHFHNVSGSPFKPDTTLPHSGQYLTEPGGKCSTQEKIAADCATNASLTHVLNGGSNVSNVPVYQDMHWIERVD